MASLSRREFVARASAIGLASLLGPRWLRADSAATGRKPNVLFIAVDDLRPQLGCYGHEQMISPNLDVLAARGTLFNRAYCQEAICAASRCSLLAGVRPDTTKIYGLKTPLRKAMPDVLSLPQHFKKNGYETVSLGKIYHHGNDDRVGWSTDPWRARGKWRGRGYLTKEAQAQMRVVRSGGRARRGLGPAYEVADVADNAYPDGMTADRAIVEMRRMKQKPFFLATGFFKPHLPFNTPKKYWDLYDHAKIRLPDYRKKPKGAPEFALTNWGELRSYTDIPARGNLSDEKTKTLIHAYYACVSYIDAQIGRLIAELDRLGLRENTIVIVWGDHGWKLGEYNAWCKHTNFELDTRVPMILSAPGQKSIGAKTDALVEFVDIYPTLCELAGLTVPGHLEGVSMAPLLTDPAREWKSAAFSQYPRGRAVMGYSMRTARYRFTEWRRRPAGVAATELYDHQSDPGETRNVAALAGNEALVARLGKKLRAGWKAARPAS